MGLEVVLRDPRFDQVRPHVGPAKIFWSHMQAVQVVGTWNSTLFCIAAAMTDPWHSESLPVSDQRYIWLDYFSLRQAQQDFDLAIICQLIRDIGILAAELDAAHDALLDGASGEHARPQVKLGKVRYFSRSFCLFEAFAAITCENVEFIPMTNETSEVLWLRMQHAPIKSHDAQAKAKDKQIIDQYITKSIGFDAMDKKIYDAILKHVPSTPNVVWNVLTNRLPALLRLCFSKTIGRLVPFFT